MSSAHRLTSQDACSLPWWEGVVLTPRGHPATAEPQARADGLLSVPSLCPQETQNLAGQSDAEGPLSLCPLHFDMGQESVTKMATPSPAVFTPQTGPEPSRQRPKRSLSHRAGLYTTFQKVFSESVPRLRSCGAPDCGHEVGLVGFAQPRHPELQQLDVVLL